MLHRKESGGKALAARHVKRKESGFDPMVVMLTCLFVGMLLIIVFGTMARSCSRVEGSSSSSSSYLGTNLSVTDHELRTSALWDNETVSLIERYSDLTKPIQVTNTYSYGDNVEELLQNPWLSGGCEPVSLTAMLNAMGYDVSAFEICDDYLEYGSSFVYTYSGDPYFAGMAYPPAMVNCANAFLEAQGSTAAFVDLTGRDFEELHALTSHGVPVLVWTTMSMDQPMFTGIEEDDYEWYANEHCVLVYGIDEDYVLVMDPLDGIVLRDRELFEDLYDKCGKMAVSLAV